MNATVSSDLARLRWRRRRAERGCYDHGPPLSRASSLPLLFFVTCLIAGLSCLTPRAAHVILIELPFLGDYLDPQGERNSDHLAIDDHGMVRWNGTAVDARELNAVLAAASHDPRFDYIEFDPDKDAPFGAVFHTLAIVWRAGLAKERFCITDYSRFQRLGEVHDTDLTLDMSIPCDAIVPPIETRRP